MGEHTQAVSLCQQLPQRYRLFVRHAQATRPTGTGQQWPESTGMHHLADHQRQVGLCRAWLRTGPRSGHGSPSTVRLRERRSGHSQGRAGRGQADVLPIWLDARGGPGRVSGLRVRGLTPLCGQHGRGLREPRLHALCLDQVREALKNRIRLSKLGP